MKKYKTIELVIFLITLILVVAVATVLGALQVSSVIDLNVNVFLLMFTVLTLGIGLFLTIFAIVKKGGYEYAIGGLVLLIGIVLLMICVKAKTLVIVIVGVGLLAIYVLSIILLKANDLIIERTNERDDFVPYMEKLEKEKQIESENKEELPEIKSFKD